MTVDATAFGLPVDASHLPEGYTPLEAVVCLKVLDADGEVAYYDCATNTLTSVEGIGMAIIVADRLRKAVLTDD